MEKREAERKRVRAEDREKAITEKKEELAGEEEKTEAEKEADLQAAMDTWDEARDQEEADNDENDESKPDLEKMMEDAKTAIIEQIEKD